MSPLSESTQYREALEPDAIFKLLIAGAILFLGYLLMIPYRDENVPRILLLFILIALIGSFMAFRRLKIEVSEIGLRVGFRILGSEILFSDIKDIEVIDPPFWRYGGLGYRLGLDGSIGYVLNFREGIRISRKNGRDIFFSTDNPGELATILKKSLS